MQERSLGKPEQPLCTIYRNLSNLHELGLLPALLAPWFHLMFHFCLTIDCSVILIQNQPHHWVIPQKAQVNNLISK